MSAWTRRKDRPLCARSRAASFISAFELGGLRVTLEGRSGSDSAKEDAGAVGGEGVGLMVGGSGIAFIGGADDERSRAAAAGGARVARVGASVADGRRT